MNQIAILGQEIDTLWRTRNYHLEVFPEIAASRLRDWRSRLSARPEEVARWVGESELPRQVRLESTFGEAPVTCFANQHLYIELLFWLDGTTSIHQHGFSGAFHVLGGSSLHTRYRFTCRERINSRLLIGDIERLEPQLLETGAVEAIQAGDRFVHSLFHLDRPSMTLVVRTFQDPGTAPQYEYLPPCLARDPFLHPRDERLGSLLRIYDLLAEFDPQERLRAMEDYLATADLHSCFELLEHQFLSRPMERQELERLIDAAVKRHGARAAPFRSAFAEKARQLYIWQRRVLVRAPEHRFFMSLLLNCDDRESLMNLVSRRYPSLSPVDVVMRWVREISEIQLSERQGTNPLGFEFGDVELTVLRALIEGEDGAEVIPAVRERYLLTPEDEETLGAVVQALRNAVLFRPLMTRRTSTPAIIAQDIEQT